MKKTNSDRRLTLVACTLIAAAILGAAVTAQHGHRQPLSALAELESDLRIQLQMAFRHDTTQHQIRQEQLDQVLNAWLQSPRSPADRQLLTQWLRQSIRDSMPGSTHPLPSLPSFSRTMPPQLPAKLPAKTNTLNSLNPEDIDHETKKPSEAVEREESDAAMRTPSQNSAAIAVSDSQIASVPTKTALPESSSISAYKTTQPEPHHGSRTAAPLGTSHQKQTTLFTGHSNSSSQTLAQKTNLSKTLPASEVTINLIELAARTAGYHDGLNEIEADLFQLNELGDVLQKLTIAKWSLRKLQQLIDDYQFIKLYDSLLSKKQRQLILAPHSPAILCERFSNCLDQWSIPRGDDYLKSFDSEPTPQQATLQALRKELAALSAQLGN
ncbi:MAG: hypothetical protein ABGX16_20490 [Pirellulales bacterium]